MMKEFYQQKLARHPKIIPVSIIGIIFLLPCIVIFVILPPFNASQNHQKMIAKYKLPQDYQLEDLRVKVDKMKEDEDFKFYFLALNEERVKESIQKSFQILKENKDSPDLLKAVFSLQGKIRAKAAVFAYMDFSQGGLFTPDEAVKLKNDLLNFVEDEFTLTILGLIYKTNFDEKFRFDWDELTLVAARNVRSLMVPNRP